ncbi:MAG: hypothetical protein C4291_03010 [Candidatus Dadabacteria bacterium]
MREFNLSSPDKLKQLKGMVIQDTVNNLATVRFLRGFLRRMGIQRDSEPITEQTNINDSDSGSESLASKVVATYRNNMELVKALAEHYHFKCLFYWQPTIFQKVYLTKYERLERYI